jgi:hypothetical protein
VGLRNDDDLLVSHLLFEDDILIFCEANPNHLHHLRCLLCFEAIFGLKINLSKSELVLVDGMEDVGRLARILGCRVSSLPMKYLSLPLGASYKAKLIWDSIIEKMERRLASWKRLYLSKGGRLMLIKSTLSNLLTYHLSLVPIRIGVANCVEKLQQVFLWGGVV